ncbi:MAG: hypothetical protein M8352_10560 [ANME-2 cluster archaeon]|nr:hypothetical protein [ANME-2 cluster archaeon]
MIDKETISAKFDIIERNMEFLNEFEEMNEDDFLNTYKTICKIFSIGDH